MSLARRSPSPIRPRGGMTVLGGQRLPRFARGPQRPGRAGGVAGQALALVWRKRGPLAATLVVRAAAAARTVAASAARVRLEFSVGLSEAAGRKGPAAAVAFPASARRMSPRPGRAVMIERRLLRWSAERHVRLLSHCQERESTVLHRVSTLVRTARGPARREAAAVWASRRASGRRVFTATGPSATRTRAEALSPSARQRWERAGEVIQHPVPRVFATTRLGEERRSTPPRLPAPPMRPLELFWRAAPTESPSMAVERASQGVAEMASRSGFASGLAALQTASSTPPAPAAAPVIDAATIDRIAHDVIGRVEKRARIERERRGL